MKYVNQLEHPHLMYKAGKPLDYDFYLRYLNTYIEISYIRISSVFTPKVF